MSVLNKKLYACLTCVSSDYKNTGKMYCKNCIQFHLKDTNHISKEYYMYDNDYKCSYCGHSNDKIHNSNKIEKTIKNLNEDSNYFNREE